jgi:hypothetical protein
MTTPLTNMTNPNLLAVNSLIKSFESHDVMVFQSVVDNKTVNWIRATDIARILDIKYIHRSIQNFDEDEKGWNQVQTLGGTQNIVFLTSDGVCRLLFNSTKPKAKIFRKWACAILNDINFNDSRELAKAIEIRPQVVKSEVYNETFIYIRIRLPEEYLSKISKEKDLSLNVIKPGIAYYLRQRNNGYNEEASDNGYFFYSFPMNSRQEAELIEKIYKLNFKETTVFGSTEYFDTVKLAKLLKFDEFVPNCYKNYLELAKRLFDYIVSLVKFNFPGYNHNGYIYTIQKKEHEENVVITTNRTEIFATPDTYPENKDVRDRATLFKQRTAIVKLHHITREVLQTFSSVSSAAALFNFTTPEAIRQAIVNNTILNGFAWREHHPTTDPELPKCTRTLNKILKRDAKTNEVIEEFESAAEAGKACFPVVTKHAIFNALRSGGTSCGYRWTYSDDNVLKVSTKPPSIRVKRTDKDGNVVIFNSVGLAAKSVQLSQSAISGTIRKGNTSAGYHFEYADEKNKKYYPHLDKVM